MARQAFERLDADGVIDLQRDGRAADGHYRIELASLPHRAKAGDYIVMALRAFVEEEMK